MARRLRALALLLASTSAALGAAALGTADATAGPPFPAQSSMLRAHEIIAPAPVAVAAPPKPRASAPVRVVTAPKPVAKPHRVKATAAPRVRAPRVQTPTLTPAQLMRRAINRLPDVRPGDVVFILKPGLDSWGLAELHGTVWISPRVPARRMYDVVAHEWSHVLSAKAYGGDVQLAVAEMNTFFGGSGITGAERAADCMARQLGATWTHYTSCSDSRWRAGAKRLLNRQRL